MGLARFIGDRLRLLRNSLLRHNEISEPPTRKLIGERGEKLAARYLKRKGMRVLYRNFRATHGGEVDIVARDGGVLAFVEVKARTTDYYGRPMDAVNMDKRFLIARGAFEWMRRLDAEGTEINYRFDVVEILLKKGQKEQVNLIKGAFEAPDSYLSR